MTTTELNGASVPKCLYCDGRWLPVDVIDTKSSLNDRNLLMTGISRIIDEGKSSSRNCPVCVDQPLTAVDVSSSEIDVCPNCSGVFLDLHDFNEGELHFKKSNYEPGALEAAALSEVGAQVILGVLATLGGSC